MDTITIQNSNSIVEVTTQGAYVIGWRFKKSSGEWVEVLYKGSELKRTGIPLLFPNFNAGDPLPSHGFGRHLVWQVEERAADMVKLGLSDNDLSKEFKEIYPYKFKVFVELSVSDSSLFYTLKVMNLGDKSLPVCPGLHPYWVVKHEEKGLIKTLGVEGLDITKIDWDNNPPDTSFDFSGIARFEFSKYKLDIADTSETIKYLQVWSQNKTKPDFDFVCFEPVCGKSNAINDNPILVEGEWAMKLHFRVE